MNQAAPGTKLETALALLDDGIDLVRCRIRRERPDANEAQVDAAVEQWLQRDVGHVTGTSARFFRLRTHSDGRQ